MSRVIVKNIDNSVDASYLNEIFSLYGTVTDVKIPSDGYGRPKNFGFVGFNKIESMKKAIKNLDGTFIHHKKVSVQQAQPKQETKSLHLHRLVNKRISSGSLFSTKFILNDYNENFIENGFLCVKNIHTTCKVSELEIMFRNFGYIDHITIPAKQSVYSNVAYIKFGLPEYAIHAAACLDGKIFQGKILRIVPCINHKYSILKHNSTFNDYCIVKRKLIFECCTSYRSWFSLFISEDLILKNLISKYGKEQYISSCGRPLKINRSKNVVTEGRMQNEAFLILKREGLNLNAFNPNEMNFKSRKIILVKNMHIKKRKTFEILLSNMKQALRYVILPMTGIILIEFKTTYDAILAYSQLEKLSNNTHKFFLIQWAPLHSFNSNFKYQPWSKRTSEKSAKSSNVTNITNTCTNYLNKKTIKNAETNTAFKLLVRNIPFSLSLKALKNMFSNFDHLLSIRIPKKKNGRIRGFCFVEFSNLDATKKAFALMQNVHLQKRRLSCSIV